MNNNFTAQDLIILHKNAVETFSETVEAIHSVKDACHNMSNVVKSEDSNLAGAWDSVAQSMADPVKKAESSFDFIGNALNSYVQKTVANEETAESGLAAVEAEIVDLGKIAGGLVDLGSAAGGDAQAIPGPTADGNTPSVIYAPPTPTGSAPSGPSVIYAPPTPSVSGMTPNNGGTGIGAIGGTSAANTPSVIYAPPTPSVSGMSPNNGGTGIGSIGFASATHTPSVPRVAGMTPNNGGAGIGPAGGTSATHTPSIPSGSVINNNN